MSNRVRIFIGIVLAVFTVESALTVYYMGYIGFFEAAVANPATQLMLLDLVLCLSMIGVWIWSDARQRGVNPIPYLIVAATFGAAGPLLYLVRRREGEETSDAGERTAQLA